DMDMGIADLRARFERGEHQSLEVLFYELVAEHVIRPEAPQPLASLTADDRARWLARTSDHERALDIFLAGDRARVTAAPFDAHRLDERGMRAFMTDCERRIAVADAPDDARQWWTQLGERRPA